MKCRHYFLLSSLGLLLLALPTAKAQNCFNSDFETGTVTGYDTYTGSILNDGTAVINFQTLDPERHKLVSILDGFDEIAMEYCQTNQFLPVVPPAGGIYAMRLGNSNSGSEAEKIVLRFTVTDENSFFLLRYAVLLNDPSHQDHEQPRFKLSITDQNGDEYPCGRYEVVAAPNLENFENCDENWKVRPWTNIGIELLSYIGEEIIIEMSTTDCALGAHAGYAYLDATCRPLEIELFNNCSDTSTAVMKVTPGFDAYQWSTGHTGNEIEIPNPVIGDIYYVTVTSATGCDLVLYDTIPPYEVPMAPMFGPATSVDYCQDTTFWFTPDGVNLEQIYSIEHQTFVDSVFINTIISNEFTFVAYSEGGCAFDTVTHYFGGLPAVIADIAAPDCGSSLEGSIILSPVGENTTYQYAWSNGMTGDSIGGVAIGTYFVTITDQAGCTIINEYLIESHEPMTGIFLITDYPCLNSFGSAVVDVSGGVQPYLYSYDNGMNFSSNDFYTQFEIGENIVLVKDFFDCVDTLKVTFDSLSLPVIDDIFIDLDSCGFNQNTIVVLEVSGGMSPYQYALNNLNFMNASAFGNVGAGLNLIHVQDARGCIAVDTIDIPPFPEFEITDLVLDPASCEQANGSVLVFNTDASQVEYALDNSAFQNSNSFDNILAGEHLVFALSASGCIDTMAFILDGTPLPRIDDLIFDLIPCSDGRYMISVEASQGQGSFSYQMDDSEMQASSEFGPMPDGWHELIVTDQNLCQITESFYLEPVDSFTYNVDYVLHPDCGETNGEIIINLTGGYGDRSIEYEEDNYPDLYAFTGLTDGAYTFILRDEANCEYEVDLSLLADCEVYIPNAFSPNGDEKNDLFTIGLAENATATLNRLNVYDRWGNRVFSATDEFISGKSSISWDGIFKNQHCDVGVYVYELELTMYNDVLIQRDGSVTIVR